MALATKKWTRVSVYKVFAALLISERETNVQPKLIDRGFITDAEVARLLDAPDFGNPEDNVLRMRLLYSYRRPFLGELPPDTAWYEVENLTDAELSQLYVIGRCGWDDADHDRNDFYKWRRGVLNG